MQCRKVVRPWILSTPTIRVYSIFSVHRWILWLIKRRQWARLMIMRQTMGHLLENVKVHFLSVDCISMFVLIAHKTIFVVLLLCCCWVLIASNKPTLPNHADWMFKGSGKSILYVQHRCDSTWAVYCVHYAIDINPIHYWISLYYIVVVVFSFI